jgi:ISXO2 transposase-like protein
MELRLHANATTTPRTRAYIQKSRASHAALTHELGHPRTVARWIGTHHGVSAKHLPRYLREWSYRFNRRNLSDGLDGYLIRRAVECATITYDQLKAGAMPGGANRVR